MVAHVLPLLASSHTIGIVMLPLGLDTTVPSAVPSSGPDSISPVLVLADPFRVPLIAASRPLPSEPLLSCKWRIPAAAASLRDVLLSATADLGSVGSHASVGGTGGFTLNLSRRLHCGACCCERCGAAGGGCATAAATVTEAAADGNRLPLNEEWPPVEDKMLDRPFWLAPGVDTSEDGELRSQADDSVKRSVAAEDPRDSAEVCEASPVHPDIRAAARDTAVPERDAATGALSLESPRGSVGGSELVPSGAPVVTGGAQVCREPCGILSEVRGA